MIDRTLLLVALVTLCLALTGCGKEESSNARPNNDPHRAQVLPTTLKEIGLVPATVMYLPDAPAGHVETARQIVQRINSNVAVLDDYPTQWNEAAVVIKPIDRETFTPLSVEQLSHRGRGLTLRQAQALQESKEALAMLFVAPPPTQNGSLKVINETILEIANATGGLIYDDETREMFTPELWRRMRLGHWHGDLPDVRAQVGIHAAPSGERYRAVTLGMSKMGCPDIVVDALPPKRIDAMGGLMNLVAQTLVEQAMLPAGGTIAVDIEKLEHRTHRSDQLALREPGAQRIVDVDFRIADAQPGDPKDTLLIELTFTGVEGDTPQQRQAGLLRQVYGEAIVEAAVTAEPEGATP